MTLRLSLLIAIAGAALVSAAPAAADPWGADGNQAIVRVPQDVADHAAVAALQRADLAKMLDARERSLVAKQVRTTTVAPEPVHDDHFRLGPSSVPPSAGSAGSSIDWPQIGAGFVGGVLLAVALLLAVRVPRPRLRAH